ncbi:MAG: NAD-dependent epimerase/dehydratase family protein [Bacteroidetes bacterium]|nr:NAD-dependent epimerase/dehydratase family protein [Bacteroidota bacterium]
MTKVGITGASGHIGGVLCEMLLAKGYEIGILSYKSKVDLDVPQDFGSITDKKVLNDFVAKYDYIIHMAADISVDGSSKEAMWQTNVVGSDLLAQACFDNKIKRLVHCSSIAAIEQFPLDQAIDETRSLVNETSLATAYGKSKAEAERRVLAWVEKGLDAVIVAPTSVLGPQDRKPSVLGQSLLDIYLNRLPALVGGGQDWVDVRDIAEGTIAALERGRKGEKYLLGSEFFSIQELALMIGDIYKKKVPTLVLPFWLARLGVPFEQIKTKISGKPNGFTQEALTALKYGNTKISHQKASDELGYKPRPVREALKDAIDWLLEFHEKK